MMEVTALGAVTNLTQSIGFLPAARGLPRESAVERDSGTRDTRTIRTPHPQPISPLAGRW